MNFWGLTPEFVKVLEDGFVEFFEKSVPANPLKAEYLLPIYIGELLEKNAVTVQVLPTHDKWFGVTYKEDKQTVIDSFAKLVADGVYPEKPVQRPEALSPPVANRMKYIKGVNPGARECANRTEIFPRVHPF